MSAAEAGRIAEACLPELRAERAAIEADLATIPEPPKVVTLKPALVARYRRDLETLDAAIRENGHVSDEAKKILRDIVSTVTVFPPGEDGKPAIQIDGYLSNLVDQDLSQRSHIRGERW